MRASIVMLTGLLVILPCLDRVRAEAPAPDFSAGFVRLVELGLPPLDASAVWVASREVNLPYALRQRVKPFKGAGWLIGAGKEARILPLGGLEPAEAKPSSAKPDLDKDLEVLIAAITKETTGDEDRNIFSYYGDGDELVSALMIFAAQLHQTGRAEQANRLAAALFTAFPEREPVIDSAVNKVAESDYNKLTEEFFERQDWAAYHAGLVALTARFPRGWRALEAARVFLPQLAKQAEGLTPQPPTLPEIEIDPRALAAVAALNGKIPARPATDGNLRVEMSDWRMARLVGDWQGGGGCWLLDDPAEARNANEATAILRSLGVAALPALAGLLADPFLTPRPNTGGGGGQSSSWDGDEYGLARIYDRMKRPATRGEIARQLLLGTLPDPDRELSRADDDELRELTVEFWRAHRAATREDLALVFLREGGEYQARAAVAIMAKAADAKFHEAVEEYLLAQDPAHGAYDLVKSYLQLRKQAAQPFFQKYAALVRSQVPADLDEDAPMNSSADYRLRDMGGVEKLLKSLAALVNDKEPRAVAVEIAKGKPENAEAAIRGLWPAMAAISSLKQLHAWLEGAHTAKDPAVRGYFLAAALSVNWPVEAGDASETSDQPRRKVSAAEERVWRKLMSDQRETGGFLLTEFYGRALPLGMVADWACAAFEESMVPNGGWALVHAAQYMDRTALDLLRETAAARIAGQPVPMLPDAEKVPRERLEAIVAETGKLQPAAIMPFLKTLSMDERAAWGGWFEEPGADGPERPPSVEALKWYVHGRSADDRRWPPPSRAVATFEPGFVLDAEWLLTRCKIIAEKPDSFSPYYLHLEEDAVGLEVTEVLLKPDPAPQPSPKPGSTAGEALPAEEDRDDDSLEDFWPSVFVVAKQVLHSHPEAVAAIWMSGGFHDADMVVLVTKDRQLALATMDGEERAGGDVAQALRTYLSDHESDFRKLFALARADIPLLYPAADDGEDGEEGEGETDEDEDENGDAKPAAPLLPPTFTEPIPE